MQINLHQFYGMGIVCFLVIAAANIFSVSSHWVVLDLGAKVSGIFGIIFNFGLVGFFRYLKNELPQEEKDTSPEEVNFEEMIDKLE